MEPDQPSPADPAKPLAALPVLEYRTARRSTEPARTAFSTMAALWGALMLVGGIVGMLATFAHYDTFRRENERLWFANELDRRTYEINRLNGITVGTPPSLYRGVILHRWVHWVLPWFPLAMSALGAALLSISRDARRGTASSRWRPSLPWLYLVPSLFLIVVACEYRLESWRFLSIEAAFVGWLAVGTLAMAWWVQLELKSTAR